MTIAKHPPIIKIKSLKALINQGKSSKVDKLDSRQLSRTLYALIQSGDKGITALELSNTWALRLSAYIHGLRHKYDLNITTTREKHDGGWHARYVLNTPVTIVEVIKEG